TVSPNPATVGQTVTLTARVDASVFFGVIPSGTVTFLVDGTAVGTGTLISPAPPIAGSATFTTSSLTAGTHQVTARSGGDTAFTPSTSAPVSLDVVQVTTSTSLTVSPNPANANQQVTFTATVTPTVPAGVTGFAGISGTAAFLVDGTQVGSVAVSSTGNAA